MERKRKNTWSELPSEEDELPLERMCTALFCDYPRYSQKCVDDYYVNVHIYYYCLYHEFIGVYRGLRYAPKNH
jgi:hypothetical protein